MQETVNASNRYQWKLVDNEYADMAQLAEQLICNQQVEGSSPPIGLTTLLRCDIIILVVCENDA